MLFDKIASPRVITSISRSILYRPQLKLFMSTEIRKAIEDAIASAPVVLFMKGTPEFPQCGFSRATVALLGKQGVDPVKFAAYNVLEDPELREAIKEFSNWPTIPQLYVNKEFVGGCDVLTSMASSGELADLLEEADALISEEAENPQVEQEQNQDISKKN
ncbi:monothiol glutaredoxin GRX5 PWA37_000942 [Arxiozyma heterogenica]